MRNACIMICLFAVALLATSSAFALEIRVAPKTLVISSNGGQLTVHTDVKYWLVDQVELKVNGTSLSIHTFADNLGNLVAQCTKESVVEVIGDFNGRTTTATVELTVNGVMAPAEITIRK